MPKPKKKKNKLSYTNALGTAYAKSPTPELAEQLLNAFEGFIQKYVTLLSPNKKITSRDLTTNTKDLLHLLIRQDDYKFGKEHAYQTVLARLPNMAIQSLNDDVDIKQTIIILLWFINE